MIFQWPGGNQDAADSPSLSCVKANPSQSVVIRETQNKLFKMLCISCHVSHNLLYFTDKYLPSPQMGPKKLQSLHLQ